MILAELKARVTGKKPRKRLGRGESSGHGKTCGRGTKGSGARAGYRRRARYEGGQMPLYRRLPKRGFTHGAFRTEYAVVNVGLLARTFPAGAEVTAHSLRRAGVIKDPRDGIKVLGFGEVAHPLAVTVRAVSASARAKIEAAGGTVTIETRPAREVRVDLAALAGWDRTREVTLETLRAAGIVPPAADDAPVHLRITATRVLEEWPAVPRVVAHSFQPRARRLLRSAGAELQELA